MHLTGHERFFGDQDVIVSKTDLKGHITYANHVFQDISLYSEEELLGQPHNIIRHPAMPRAVFKLLWDVIGSGQEIFAYVINRCKNGDHYWVFAHVTPTFDEAGRIIGYHSSRRVPERGALARIEPVYAQVLAEEAKHKAQRDQVRAGTARLTSLLEATGMPYEEFVFSL